MLETGLVDDPRPKADAALMSASVSSSVAECSFSWLQEPR